MELLPAVPRATALDGTQDAKAGRRKLLPRPRREHRFASTFLSSDGRQLSGSNCFQPCRASRKSLRETTGSPALPAEGNGKPRESICRAEAGGAQGGRVFRENGVLSRGGSLGWPILAAPRGGSPSLEPEGGAGRGRGVAGAEPSSASGPLTLCVPLARLSPHRVIPDSGDARMGSATC